jgi:hypothetical protein
MKLFKERQRKKERKKENERQIHFREIYQKIDQGEKAMS